MERAPARGAALAVNSSRGDSNNSVFVQLIFLAVVVALPVSLAISRGRNQAISIWRQFWGQKRVCSSVGKYVHTQVLLAAITA